MHYLFRPKLIDALRNYDFARFSADLMGGLIVGIVALPLAIAFGIASGVPPETGIITAVIGGFLVSALGGSSVQIGGPTGAFIIIVYGIIHQHGIDGLLIATVLAGILLLVMGLLKLGNLIKFIPYPIVVGFTAGIALTIFSTQINDLLGLGISEVPSDFFDKWICYFRSFGSLHPTALAFGVGSILIIALIPRFTSKVPGSLVAIVLLTLLAYFLREKGVSGIDTIGDRFDISGGISLRGFPELSLERIRVLFPSAFTIALLGAIESLLSASVADGITGERHRSNTELIAQGIANITVPVFGGIPVTGAIARTMTNINNGGRTPVAGIIHAGVLLLIFLFLAPLMDYIPMACLAGILVVVAYNMSGWRSIIGIARGNKGGAAVMLTTFLLTVVFDLTVAIEVGLLLSMLIFMKRITETTDIAVSKKTIDLGDKETENSDNGIEMLDLPDGVEVYEINGPYFFGIANRFEEIMLTVGDKARVRIIRMRRVPFMDTTALHNLEGLIRTGHKDGVQFVLSGVSPKVRTTLEQSAIDKLIGHENICTSIHESVARARRLTEAD